MKTMMEDFESDVSFPSRSRDKDTSVVRIVTSTDLAMEGDDVLSHRSTRGKSYEHVI
jgi:hypothetical protein